MDWKFHGSGLRGLARVVAVAATGAPPCMRLHTIAHQESPGGQEDLVKFALPPITCLDKI